MKRQKTKQQFVICIQNNDCEDLEPGKVYQVLPDESASPDGYIRVIDESGEDYLYPVDYFVFVDLPVKAEQALFVDASSSIPMS
jgi:hypothetical protein